MKSSVEPTRPSSVSFCSRLLIFSSSRGSQNKYYSHITHYILSSFQPRVLYQMNHEMKLTIYSQMISSHKQETNISSQFLPGIHTLIVPLLLCQTGLAQPVPHLLYHPFLLGLVPVGSCVIVGLTLIRRMRR